MHVTRLAAFRRNAHLTQFAGLIQIAVDKLGADLNFSPRKEGVVLLYASAGIVGIKYGMDVD